jgi:aspartyl/glutamyl-tRNA(Asn/Gln) amidotransferase C subunit
MPEISLQEVSELALFARLHLSDDEKHTMQSQLRQILTAMQALANVATDGVIAMTHAVPVDLRLRPDSVEPSLSPADAVASSASATHDLFVVPAAIGPHE